jgi:hypothetical protein
MYAVVDVMAVAERTLIHTIINATDFDTAVDKRQCFRLFNFRAN